MAATTHIIDWKSGVDANVNKPPITIITAPETIGVGDVVTIHLYSAYKHALISPYNGVGNALAKPDELIDEMISLSGSAEVSAAFPIASVSSMVAALPIIDEVTHTIVVGAGLPLSGLFDVVNQQLKLKNPALKLHGGVQLRYHTFPAQSWTHTPFAKKGSALLFAQNLTTLDYENIPLTIGDQSSNSGSIKIEGYPITPNFGANPYAGFIVFPARANAIVLTDYGDVLKNGDVSHKIGSEQINFAGKKASAAFYIDSKLSFTGYFFDAKHKVITPTFTVSDGELVSNVDCYGLGFLTYMTNGTVYDYSAEITFTPNPNGLYGSYSTVVGTIFVFDPEKIGIAATYTIPLNNINIFPRQNMLEVYREVLVIGENSYEKPDNSPAYPEGNAYVHYPDLNAATRPPIGDAYAVTRWVHETVFVQNGAVNNETEAVNWFYPAATGEAFNGAVFKLTDNIPTEATTDMPVQLITALNNAKVDLLTKYGISA